MIRTYYEDKTSEARYTKIQKQYKNLTTDNSLRPQFEALENINQDIVGWIQLKGTSLNYPILQGKTNHDYLRKDFEREHSRKGSIFMDYRNHLETPDRNTIIYGHHMGDNTMFDVLEKYLNQSFYDQHPSIQYDTKYGKYQLDVVSAYLTTTKNNYIQTQFKSQQDYTQFLNKTMQSSKIKTATQLNSNDKIVTLSTCEDAYNETAGRIVVVCKLVKQDK